MVSRSKVVPAARRSRSTGITCTKRLVFSDRTASPSVNQIGTRCVVWSRLNACVSSCRTTMAQLYARAPPSARGDGSAMSGPVHAPCTAPGKPGNSAIRPLKICRRANTSTRIFPGGVNPYRFDSSAKVSSSTSARNPASTLSFFLSKRMTKCGVSTVAYSASSSSTVMALSTFTLNGSVFIAARSVASASASRPCM